MKKSIIILLLFAAFNANAQESFFRGNNNYVAAPRIPTVGATIAATLITPYSANVGGAGIEDGGYVTEKGLVWSTSSNPTIDLLTKRIYGLGSGNFTTNINGLSPATTYYVRCFAKNIVGTSYGSQISFTTPAVPSDYSLHTVNVGNQVWTDRNLEVSNYRNGDPIPFASTAADWAAYNASQTGAYMYLRFQSAGGQIYGKLYNWYAVNDSRGLAPAGYHIPLEAEWTTLKASQSGNEKALKSNTDDWGANFFYYNGTSISIIPTNDYYNYNGTNATGFNCLPAGGSSPNGGTGIEAAATFWLPTPSATDASQANWMFFHQSYNLIYGKSCCGAFDKGNGMSIRLVKD